MFLRAEWQHSLMRDLTNPRHMLVKAALFAVIGSLSAALLFIDRPSLRTATLLALTIWAFSRLYYFAFYVIERYIDPTFRFSGIFAALRYLAARRKT